jgi:hypothetical protein
MTDNEQAAFGGAGSVRRRTGDELVAAWKAGHPPPLRVGPTAEDLDRPPLRRGDALLVAVTWAAGLVAAASVGGMLWLVWKVAA